MAPQTELIDETGRVVFRGTQSPGGGSQTVSVIDCGVIQVADVVRGGALVLVPAAEGRLIKSVRFGSDEYAPPSDGGTVWFATTSTAGRGGFAYFSASAPVDTLGLITASQQTPPSDPSVFDASYSQILSSGPLVAGSSGPGNGLSSAGLEFIPPVTWQANHAYRNATWLIDTGDHVWVSTNGVSGGSEPDFLGNQGGSVADGTVTWQDQGAIPIGSCHVYAEVIDTGNPSPPHPAALEYLQQPTDADADATIAPAVTVRVLDQHGDPYTAISLSVVVFIVGDGTLGGTTLKTTVDGLATFDDLAITEPGSGYVLQAVLYPSILINAVDSDPFNITAP